MTTKTRARAKPTGKIAPAAPQTWVKPLSAAPTKARPVAARAATTRAVSEPAAAKAAAPKSAASAKSGETKAAPASKPAKPKATAPRFAFVAAASPAAAPAPAEPTGQTVLLSAAQISRAGWSRSVTQNADAVRGWAEINAKFLSLMRVHTEATWDLWRVVLDGIRPARR